MAWWGWVLIVVGGIVLVAGGFVGALLYLAKMFEEGDNPQVRARLTALRRKK